MRTQALISLTLLVLHCTVLQCIIFFFVISKTFFIPKFFQLKQLTIVLRHLFFSIFKTFPRWCLLVQNNGNMSLWNVSNMHENQWTKFVQSQQKKHKKNIKVVLLVSLLSTSEVWVLRTQPNIYVGAFFAIQRTKAKIFIWVLNTRLKLWADFTFINWIWFDWVTWRFSVSSMSTFIQIFQKLVLKKNIKQFDS